MTKIYLIQDDDGDVQAAYLSPDAAIDALGDYEGSSIMRVNLVDAHNLPSAAPVQAQAPAVVATGPWSPTPVEYAEPAPAVTLKTVDFNRDEAYLGTKLIGHVVQYHGAFAARGINNQNYINDAGFVGNPRPVSKQDAINALLARNSRKANA